MKITSTRNPLIKYVRSLERASVRREEDVYLAEGVRLVTEALQADQQATLVLYDPALLNRSAAGSQLLEQLPDWAERSYEVDERVLSTAAQTETPSGVLAVLRRPQPLPLAVHAEDRFGLILDRLADPGNAGTILRTAAAVGVGYVIAAPGTVDLFAPKVVRAGMGAHFRLPLYTGVDWLEISEALPGVALVALEVEGAALLYDYIWPERAALVVGSEAHGLSEEALQRASARLRIPMRPGVESLNASVAASVVLYTALGPETEVATENS